MMRDYFSILITTTLVGLILWCVQTNQTHQSAAILKTTTKTTADNHAIPTIQPIHKQIKLGEPLTVTIPALQIEVEMVYVPGDESRGIKPFYIGRYEMTWDAFLPWIYCDDIKYESDKARLRAKNLRPSAPYGAFDRGLGTDQMPAFSMTQRSAKLYCQWLSEQTGYKFNLPTAKQWRHAHAHGGSPIVTQSHADQVAVYRENSWSDEADNGLGDNAPQQVGSLKPNLLGLYDMDGNLSEWIADKRETRGGHFQNKLSDLYDSRQIEDESWNRTNPEGGSDWWFRDAPWVGFRVICEIDEVHFKLPKKVLVTHSEKRPIKKELIPHNVKRPVKKYVETIPVSQEPFNLVYVPGDSSKDIKSLYVSQFEVSWYEYIPVITGGLLSIKEKRKALDLTIICPTKTPNYGYFFADYDKPALGMTYRGAIAYLHQLRKMTGIAYRLPTKKEWRYIYTSGGGHFDKPMTKEEADRVAVYKDNSWDDDYDEGLGNYGPMEIGSKKPNKHGIFDMAGNVAEWVKRNGKERVLLGGHFASKLQDLGRGKLVEDRSTWHSHYPGEPTPLWWYWGYVDIPWTGFRVVCDIENGKPKKWRSENTEKEIKEIQSIR